MAAKNDITGDSISTKSNTKEFEDGWERIFGKKKEKDPFDYVNGWPNERMFDKSCSKCGFKQNMSKESPVTLCQSCGCML